MLQSRLLALPIAGLVMLFAACGGPTGEARLSTAQQYLEKAEYGSAAIELKSYLQQKPSDGTARLLLGKAMLEQGDAKGAEVELNKAKQAGIDNDDLTALLARTWLANGSAKKVVETYGSVTLSKKQAQADLRVAIAGAHLRLGQVKEGKTALQDALSIEATHGDALLLQAKVAAVEKQYDDALRLAERSIRNEASGGAARRFRADILLGVKNDVQGALKELELAMLDRSHEATAGATRIGVLAEQGRHEEARAQLKLVKKKYPNNPAVLYSEAYVALRIGDLASAKTVADELVRKYGSEPRILQLSGAIDLKRGEFSSAATKISKAVAASASSSIGARLLLADAYLAMGDADRTITALRPLLDSNVQVPEVLTRVGQAYLLKGDISSAEGAYLRVSKIKPDDASVATSLALFDLARGQADRAFAALNEISAKDSGVVADMAAISAHLRRREFDDALKAIDRLETKWPSRPAVNHLRGEALKSKGDRAGARAAYAAALRQEAGFVASSIALAMMEMEERNFDAARQRLDALVQAAPDNAGAKLLSLRLMALQGVPNDDLQKAVAEAVRVNRSDPATRLLQVEWLMQAKDFRGALSAAQAAQAQFPDNPAMIDALGRAYLSTRDMTLAASAFEALRSAMPRSALPHLRLAELHQRQGNVAAMRRDLSQAFDVEPNSTEVRRRLLSQATDQKGADFVIELARRLKARPAQAGSALLLEADVAVARKRLDDALALYRQALSRQPNDVTAARVFDALAALGKSTEARRFADSWFKDNPGAMGFVEHVSQAALIRNDMEAAERWLGQLVRMNPYNGSALNNFAMVLSSRGSPESVAVAEKALAMLPGQPSVMDTLARALASQGRAPDAIAMQRRAVSAANGDPAFRLGLAEIYLRTGDKLSAKAELDALDALGKRFAGHERVAALRRQVAAR